MARAYRWTTKTGGWAVAAGQSCRSGDRTFLSQRAPLDRSGARQRVVGNPAALKIGGRRPPAPPARENLGSDAGSPKTGSRCELLKELADRDLVVSYTLWHFLQHEGVTFKKAFAPPNRTDRTSPGGVSGGRRVRRRSIRGGIAIERDRQAQKQHDTHPWPLRRKDASSPAPFRQIAEGPHLSDAWRLRQTHRRVMTDQSARRLPRHIEQVLITNTRAGDIVVIDNLGSHKSDDRAFAQRYRAAKRPNSSSCPPTRQNLISQANFAMKA